MQGVLQRTNECSYYTSTASERLTHRVMVGTMAAAFYDRGAPLFFWESSIWELKTSQKTDLEKKKITATS